MTAKVLLDKNPNPTDAQNPRWHEQNPLPLHDVLPDSGSHTARRENHGGRASGFEMEVLA